MVDYVHVYNLLSKNVYFMTCWDFLYIKHMLYISDVTIQ